MSHLIMHFQQNRMPTFESNLKISISFFSLLFSAAPAAHGGSQARSGLGAVATGLCQSHSNARSELRLQPTSQLTATPNP